MDEITSAVLNKLNSLSEIGNFIIVEEDELFDALPNACENKNEAVESALKKLKSCGFIEIRYSRGDVFCVAPLKKIEKAEPSLAPPPAVFPKKNIAICAVCSFLGAFFGGLLVSLIAG